MNNANYESLNRFIEGLRNDLDNHVKTENSYQNGINGRLYSHNGIVSFSSLKGTTKVHEDENIISILGNWAFDDELILIVKYAKEESSKPVSNSKKETIQKLIAYNKTVSSESNDVTFSLASSIELTSYQVDVDEDNTINYGYDQPFSCVDSSGDEINYTEYYEEIFTNNNFTTCNLIESNDFGNNKDYLDAFISISKDESGNLISRLIWKGYLNLSMTAKICCYGLQENSFYKRIYFTDYQNPFRVINVKDSNIQNRNFKEFQTFQSTALLSPIIQDITNGGQLKAGTVMYAYRLITQNGQVTEFSPFSDAVKIIKNDSSGTEYQGGDISEATSKMVMVKCNIPDWKNFKEIECIAIEYEAPAAPTAIRTLGIKSTAAFVLFTHYGSESEFDNTITLSQILDRQNTWKYCSDMTVKKNKLITSGLRNDPISNTLMNLQKDFALHSWDEFGDTHNCLINPKPWKYRFIDPENTENMYFVKEKMYEYIKVFGDFKITLKNRNTGDFFEKEFASENQLAYVDFTDRIFKWLDEIKDDPSFSAKFPNLKIVFSAQRIYFQPIVTSTQTDISDYNFEYNTKQVIEEVQEDIVFRNLSVNTSRLIYGAQSLGFNRGNGIRITYQSVLTPVLTKANAAYNGTDNILNMNVPDENKSFFKGEIYRLGFQIYDTNGYQLFNIPMGDIKIPEIGDTRKYLDANGNVVIETEYYVNSKVIGNVMHAEKIIIKAEVRLSCEIQQMISMYQLTYVERTYNNRTILCQGISAPLERTNVFYHKEHITMPDPVANKWNLPFFGGPTYDVEGLKRFDEDPGRNDEWSSWWRVITNRKMFYFDSPDVIYNRVPASIIRNGSVQRIARLNPDNDKLSWRKIWRPETFPSFSRKIRKENITGDENKESHFVNMSVFTERLGNKNVIEIDKAEELNYGQIVPASALNTTHEVSNNALTLAKQSWFYSNRARESDGCQIENGAKYELFNSSNYSPGYKTVIINASENVFTDQFIDESPTHIDGSGEMSSWTYSDGYYYSTHALINIQMNNQESVYGGRSEISYSKNIYIPLSKTIPVLKTSNNTQSFKVYGDTYTTLYARHKNGYNPGGAWELDMNNYPNCSRNKFEEEDYNRQGAWNYAFVVECSLEPKWNHNNVFYRERDFDFEQIYNESINEAYYQENTLRSFIPKPYRFRDEPDMNNIVSASEVKMSGDYIDKWTMFKVNNFYELEKDKGTVYNLAKSLDQIYAIQEHQTSQLSIDENVMMNTSNGEVSIQQGDGSAISNHNVISDYGTSIRRAVVEKSQNTKEKGGFAFLDERKFEWLNINQPLLFSRNLHLKFREIFKNDEIIDTEGYFDDEYKETNIRIRTKKGNNFILSFNEALEVFNGYIQMDNNIYLNWDEKIFTPKLTKPGEIHQLNTGVFLNFFDVQKTMTIGITVNIQPTSVKIFKAWAGIINTNYPIKKITVKTSSGQTRIISGDHYRYKIREGRHSVALKNRTDWEDLRGEWATLEVELESKNNKKVDVFSFINFVRHSFQ